MKKADLERAVEELRAEVSRLRDENSRLRHGRETFREGRQEYIAVSKIDWTSHPEREAIEEVPSRLVCEGHCLRSEYSEDDRLMSARYQLIYEDWDQRIDPAGRTYLIDYNYDDQSGTDINAVWLLEKVG